MTRAPASEREAALRTALTDIGFAHRHLLGDSDVTRDDASAALLEAERNIRAALAAHPTPPPPLDATLEAMRQVHARHDLGHSIGAWPNACALCEAQRAVAALPAATPSPDAATGPIPGHDSFTCGATPSPDAGEPLREQIARLVLADLARHFDRQPVHVRYTPKELAKLLRGLNPSGAALLDEAPQEDSAPMEQCCIRPGCKCRYAPSQRGTGHDHSRSGCRFPGGEPVASSNERTARITEAPEPSPPAPTIIEEKIQ